MYLNQFVMLSDISRLHKLKISVSQHNKSYKVYFTAQLPISLLHKEHYGK